MMIRGIHVGDQLADGCVDRVIVICHGVYKSGHYTNNEDYKCLFRIGGKWYMNFQDYGPNGDEMTSHLPLVTDSTVEAYAEEQRAEWCKRADAYVHLMSDHPIEAKSSRVCWNGISNVSAQEKPSDCLLLNTEKQRLSYCPD